MTPMRSTCSLPPASVTLASKTRVGFDQRRAVRLQHVGANGGEFGAGQRLAEEVEPVVELVVAERAAEIAEAVHRRDDGMLVAAVEALLVGDIVAEQAALDEVAVVEQDGVARLVARGGDQRGRLGEADRVVRLVATINP